MQNRNTSTEAAEVPFIKQGYGAWCKSTDPASDECCCYSITDPNRGVTKYFAKQATDGSFLNPWELTSNRLKAYMGRRPFEYKKISEEVFLYYLQFLQKQNMVSFRRAERLSKNG